MSDKADAWQMEITSITWEFEKITENLDSSELYFRPSQTSWSIAENLGHLIQLNSSYYPIFDQVIENSYRVSFLGKTPYVAKSLGKLLFRSMASKNKMKTFKIWEPMVAGDDIIPRFKDHQMELSSYIQKLEPFFGRGLVIHSPATRLLVYELDQTMNILIAHEKRHLNQCKAILAQLPNKR
jgi:hypothetical protein